MNGDESKIRKLLQEKLKESEIGEIIKAVQGNNEYSDSQLKQLFKESG